MVSTKENGRLVLSWIEARNVSDVEAAVRVWAPERQDWFRNAFNSSCEGFPDCHTTVDDLIAEGDKVVMRATMRATHLGTWQAFPPPAKQWNGSSWTPTRSRTARSATSFGWRLI